MMARRLSVKLRIHQVVFSCVLPLILLSMTVPVFAQVKYAEELQYPPLPDLVIPEPERIVLENGIVVLLMEDHELPLVSLSAFIQTGSRLETQDKKHCTNLK